MRSSSHRLGAGERQNRTLPPFLASWPKSSRAPVIRAADPCKSDTALSPEEYTSSAGLDTSSSSSSTSPTFLSRPGSSIASPAASSRPRLRPRVAGHVLESPDASSRSRLHPPVAGHALASSWPHPRIRGHIRTSPVHVVDVKHQPAPISMASSSSSWGSSFEPQLFPNNLFKLAVDLTHPTRQIFDSVREGNIGSMKRLKELREKEGKSVAVVEEINDSQNRRSLGVEALHVAAYYGKQEMCEFLIKDLNLDVNASAQHGASISS